MKRRGGTAAGPGNSYLSLFAIPGTRGFVAAGFVGRLPNAMLGLGIVLLITATTGSYGLAGVIAATTSLVYAFAVPRIARLVDRHGQRRVLAPLVAVFAASTAVFLACAQLRAPAWALFATGALVGGSMPALGSMVRSRWTHLLAGTSRLEAAFSLESVADDVLFITGPILVTLLATGVHPTAGVGVAAALSVLGTLALVAQRRTEPPVSPPEPTRAGGAVRVRGMLVLVGVFACLGAMFGTLELAMVAFAEERGTTVAAGPLLAVYSIGSAAGGLWYGSRGWTRWPVERRFAAALAGVALGAPLFAAAGGVAVMYPISFAAGLAVSPAIIAGYGLVRRAVPRPLLTEGMAWLSTAIGLGLAAGAPVAGLLVDRYGSRPGFGLAAVAAATGLLIALLGTRRLAARPGSPAPAGPPAAPAGPPAAPAGPPPGPAGPPAAPPDRPPALPLNQISPISSLDGGSSGHHLAELGR